MIESSYALYKLVILYMLEKVNFPLSNAQISEFFLEQEYTSYFHLQEVLNEMLESNLVSAENTRQTTYYTLTDNGAQTLHFFRKDISPEIQEEAENYLEKNSYRLRTESSVISDYYKSSEDDYAVHCVIKENQATLLDLTLHVPTERGAQEVCENWKKKSQEVYAALTELLF